jgi:hypothetical protein
MKETRWRSRADSTETVVRDFNLSAWSNIFLHFKFAVVGLDVPPRATVDTYLDLRFVGTNEQVYCVFVDRSKKVGPLQTPNKDFDF